MDILTIRLKDRETDAEKTYSTGRFPAYLAREIMRIRTQELEIAKTHEQLLEAQKKLDEIRDAGGKGSEVQIDTAIAQSIRSISEAILAVETDVYERLLWIICETYGKQFTPDDVDHNLSRKEIGEQIRKIDAATNGVFEKN